MKDLLEEAGEKHQKPKEQGTPGDLGAVCFVCMGVAGGKAGHL